MNVRKRKFRGTKVLGNESFMNPPEIVCRSNGSAGMLPWRHVSAAVRVPPPQTHAVTAAG